MLLTEAELTFAESMIFGNVEQPVTELELAVSEPDFESLEGYRWWKEQQSKRFGAGTPAPNIPRSQRQFDGDNWYEYCEPFRG